MKILQIILSIIVIALVGYEFVTDDFRFQLYLMMFLFFTMLVMGLRDFQKGQKGSGWLNIVLSIMLLSVSIKSFL
ncbi:hypothetical protein A374_06496 [Fictibacillus macauensis ZFHKF-1]|uniref:DUF3953 domain-containing protein n=1 Tax=Fictibacillus macauensis ZFHKF-1 TaxID=1196324 RepID=I8AK63_9BACL|nr:hypothetical protein A374_06496 [Fictibacillus macauensis ZFHKF-1]